MREREERHLLKRFFHVSPYTLRRRLPSPPPPLQSFPSRRSPPPKVAFCIQSNKTVSNFIHSSERSAERASAAESAAAAIPNSSLERTDEEKGRKGACFLSFKLFLCTLAPEPSTEGGNCHWCRELPSIPDFGGGFFLSYDSEATEIGSSDY